LKKIFEKRRFSGWFLLFQKPFLFIFSNFFFFEFLDEKKQKSLRTISFFFLFALFIFDEAFQETRSPLNSFPRGGEPER